MNLANEFEVGVTIIHKKKKNTVRTLIFCSINIGFYYKNAFF